MNVKILGFGCNWWRRFGRNSQDPLRYSKHAAFYNSTGIKCGSKMRRHWIVPGLIRFNGANGFASHDMSFWIGKTFSCTELVYAFDGNRMVFENVAGPDRSPDLFLITISGERYGAIDFCHSDWKSRQSHVIAASQLRAQQETMLLMKPGEWVATSLGKWYLTPVRDLQAGAILQLGDN